MKKIGFALLAMGMTTLGLAPGASAQVESIDPNEAYSAEYGEGTGSSWEEDAGTIYNETSPYAGSQYSGAEYDGGYSGNSGSYNAQTPSDANQQAANGDWSDPYSPSGDVQDATAGNATPGYYQASPSTDTQIADETTYQEDDLIGAAEGVFGKGAEGLAGMIQAILKEQGQPNAYIVGREAGGAFALGLRYGSGTLFHKVEGEQKVYWTGPSIGFDAGAQAGNTFVLVYNLFDSEDLYKRFAAGEGAAYLVGGFHTSYLRRGDVVLIPVRVGVGARLGVNVGYMKFSHKQNWFPF